jgi:HSP20 family protein
MSTSRQVIPSNSLFGGIDDFFTSPFTHHPAVPFLTDIERDPDMILRRSSPCYEVHENDKQFQLTVDVPGVKMTDMHITLEDDRVLHITGGREVHKTEPDGSFTTSQSKFEKTFVMDDSVNTSKVTANLQDGVLMITAPKSVAKTKTKKILITQGTPTLRVGGGKNPQGSK